MNISYSEKMQDTNEKTLQLAKQLGIVVKQLRMNKHLSVNELANEYEIHKGTLSKIENGKCNIKLATLWQLSEALDIKTSEIIKYLEEILGDQFKLIDE